MIRFKSNLDEFLPSAFFKSHVHRIILVTHHQFCMKTVHVAAWEKHTMVYSWDAAEHIYHSSPKQRCYTSILSWIMWCGKVIPGYVPIILTRKGKGKMKRSALMVILSTLSGITGGSHKNRENPEGPRSAKTQMNTSVATLHVMFRSTRVASFGLKPSENAVFSQETGQWTCLPHSYRLRLWPRKKPIQRRKN